METDELEFESASFFSPELIFLLPVVINGNKTEVSFHYCCKDEPGEYISVNLERNGSYVNSFTMNCSTKGGPWKFAEEYVPKELKVRQEEFSKRILAKKI
jgi:hypothetical protein